MLRYFVHMPGQPKWAAFLARMRDVDGLELICMSIIAGESMKAIASSLDTSLTTLYRFLSHTTDNHARFREARRVASHALVEEGQQLIDDCDGQSSSEVSKARERAGYRRWRAGVDNKEDYGPPEKGAQVQINLGDALLGALMKHGGPVEIEDGESELITDGREHDEV